MKLLNEIPQIENILIKRLLELHDSCSSDGSSGGTITTARVMEFQQALDEDVLYLGYLIQELHAEAMALRMLPLRTVTDGFIKMVRDLSKSQGKEVDLEIRGEH